MANRSEAFEGGHSQRDVGGRSFGPASSEGVPPPIRKVTSIHTQPSSPFGSERKKVVSMGIDDGGIDVPVDPPQPAQDRQTFLQGLIPESLGDQINKLGITQDYRNQFYAADLLLNIPGQEAKVSEALASTKTYSEYWKERLSDYNIRATERGLPLVDIDYAFSELVTNQPHAAELDQLAEKTRALAQAATVNPEDIRESYRAISKRTNELFYPPEDQDTMDYSICVRYWNLTEFQESMRK